MGTTPGFEVFDHLKQTSFSELVREARLINDQIKDSEEKLKDLRMEIGGHLSIVGVQSVLVDDQPVTVVDTAGRRTLDQEKLKITLVERGVSAQLVAECVEAATKVGKPTSTVRLS